MRATILVLGFVVALGLLATMLPLDQTVAAVESRPSSGSYHPDSPPAIFLDVDGNCSIDATHEGFKIRYNEGAPSGWQSSQGGAQRIAKWQDLVYPGNTYPGEVLLDNAGTGYYFVYVSMEMPTAAEMTGWYKLELWMRIGNTASYDPSDKITLDFIGGGIHETAFPYYHASDGYASVHQSISPYDSLGLWWYGCLNESPLTGLPWQYSDFSGDWGVYLTYDYEYKTAATRITTIWAALVPTTAPWTAANGNQILRPNGDLDIGIDWNVIPSGSAYAALDETNTYSDGDTTYISSSLSGFSASFNFDDPDPTLDTEASYNCTVWVYAKSSEDYSWERTMYIELATGWSDTVEEHTVITGTWHNWTMQFETSPATGRAWTWDELVDLKLWVWGSANMSVTQIAVIITDINYQAPTEGRGSWSSLDWISGGGMMALFGIFGFLGMIAAPTIAYLQYKNGEEGILAGANFVWLMMFFGGLFLCGLWFGG